MKQFSNILSIVIINIIFLIISLFIHYAYANPIAKVTKNSETIEGILFVVSIVFFIFYLGATKHSIIRKYCVAIYSIAYSVLIFTILYTNKALAKEGSYYTFELKDTHAIGDKYFLDVAIPGWATIEVTKDKCFKVDSVQVRIDEGILGIVYTNKIIIKEKINCEGYQPTEPDDSLNYNIKAGHFYAKKRCFTQAINEYTKAIANDSLNERGYYHRAMMFMVKNDFNKALEDFNAAAYVKYNKLSSNEIESLKTMNMKESIRELIDSLQISKSFNKSTIQRIELFDDFDTYQKGIKFCEAQLRK